VSGRHKEIESETPDHEALHAAVHRIPQRRMQMGRMQLEGQKARRAGGQEGRRREENRPLAGSDTISECASECMPERWRDGGMAGWRDGGRAGECSLFRRYILYTIGRLSTFSQSSK
jgi:hypothetical protein